MREDPVKRRADVEPQFLTRELGDVVGQRPAGRLQIAPGVLGEMHRAVGLVDNDARRRQAFQRFAMNARFNRRAKRRPSFVAAAAQVQMSRRRSGA